MKKPKDSLRPAKLLTLDGKDPGILANRVVERTMGCWNCCHSAGQSAVETRFKLITGLNPGDGAQEMLRAEAIGNPEFYKAVGKTAKEYRITELAAVDLLLRDKFFEIQQGKQGIILLSQAIKEKKITYCTVDASTTPGAFLPVGYLCGDNKGTPCKWKGVSGAAEARGPGQPADPLLDEVVDTLDGEAKRR